ncbi:hypothetical protein FIBSPDRAFT_851243 [Athelia psychrophila]|uniref:Pinin/SDK/MemA protein domain-containing protein n=1 Tax=Athelia psychrophila TaxID=1759441 RepID=A0A166SNB4_9AGAM|nr:hypothetical protein FIBSPDRAFT_851243 [Fibularhizoctonia sp. CBS 109695]
MSADDISPVEPVREQHENEVHVQDAPAAKRRPRLDLSDPRERRRGKSIFGLVLGTLNKAKVEDRERNASEAAKKRQLIDQRLQAKLRKETDASRRSEDAKKDKTAANRKEEELQLRDSIHKLRRARLPLLANFLLTSDAVPTDEADAPTAPSRDALAGPPRTQPAPLYYLPAVLTPAQEIFLARRKAEVHDAAEKEWAEFAAERAAGVEEIWEMRERVREEQDRKKAERESREEAAVEAKGMEVDEPVVEVVKEETKQASKVEPVVVVVEKVEAKEESKPEEKDDAMQADDDDAVEY